MENKSTDNNLALNKPIKPFVSIPMAIIFFLLERWPYFEFTPQSRTGVNCRINSKLAFLDYL